MTSKQIQLQLKQLADTIQKRLEKDLEDRHNLEKEIERKQQIYKAMRQTIDALDEWDILPPTYDRT